MKPPRLPEDFHLPIGVDYDASIESLDKDIQAEGGARLYLGKLRSTRREWQTFNRRTLGNFTKHALSLEEIGEGGKTIDPRHRIANAALTGMIFGHVINESHYPDLGFAYHPYDYIGINTDLLGDAALSFMEGGAMSRLEGTRIGYGAMAKYCLDQISQQSYDRLRELTEEAIPHGPFHTNFIFGIGLSMYAAWDLYSDKLIDEGRGDEVVILQHFGNNEEEAGL